MGPVKMPGGLESSDEPGDAFPHEQVHAPQTHNRGGAPKFCAELMDLVWAGHFEKIIEFVIDKKGIDLKHTIDSRAR